MGFAMADAESGRLEATYLHKRLWNLQTAAAAPAILKLAIPE